MVSSENENCLVVSAVREVLNEKMSQIKSREQNYNHLDLAYGVFSRGIPLSRRARILSRGGFLQEIVSGIDEVYGYGYNIELARNNKTIGYLVGAKGHRDDPLAEYCLVQLTNGESFEFEQLKNPNIKYGTIFPHFRLGHTTIRYNGSVIGECRVTGYQRLLVIKCESEWDLIFKDKHFGKIIRPEAVSWDNLFITRPDGSSLSLVLAYHVCFTDSVKGMWHILTLRAFFGKPWPKPDWIVPLCVRRHLTTEETVFYFAISLLFRVYFGLDDHGDG